MIELLRRRPDLLPSLAIAFSAALWGLFWLPVRAIEDAGVSAGWTGPVIFAAVTVVFLPAALWRWRRFAGQGFNLLTAGALAGAAFSLYATSFHMTDVVRALLLFYMTPVWSTLLGVVVLRERLSLNRLLALGLGFCGLMVVLGAGVEFPWPRRAGDWLALAAGLCWSLGSVRLFQGGGGLIFEKTFLFVLSALVLSVVLALLPLEIDRSLPSLPVLVGVWPWITALAVFLLPATYLTIWPATVLSPARVGILFMAEIVVGVGSAAVLTEEAFGLREAAGTALILSAGVVEVLRPQRV